jgi:hypothetical protein
VNVAHSINPPHAQSSAGASLNADPHPRDGQREVGSSNADDGQYGEAGNAEHTYKPHSRHGPQLASEKKYNVEDNGDPMLAMYELSKRRIRSFEDKLRAQSVDSMRRLDRVQFLDAAIAALNKALYRFAADAKGTDKLDGTTDWNKDPDGALEREINTALIDAGLTKPGMSKGKGRTNSPGGDLDGGLNGSTTKADIDAMLAKLKGMSQRESTESNINMVDLNQLTSDLNTATTMAGTIEKKNADMKLTIIRSMS